MEVEYMGFKNWFSKKVQDETKGLKKEKSIYNFLDKEGFYIILFICVCIVATTAVWVTKTNIDRLAVEKIENPILKEEINVENSKEKVPVVIVEDIEEKEKLKETVASVVIEEKKEIPQKNEKKKVDPKPKVAETAKVEQETTKKMMGMPAIGETGMNYTDDTLAYSKTLEQYTTHHGIDIIALENTPVVAALSGEVIEVTTDSRLGMTITLAHDESMITKYSNLSTNRMVTVGDWVEKGQVISGVGKSGLFESAEEPHLHFEVLIDGNYIDPNKFLPIE